MKKKKETKFYGLLAKFDNPESLVKATTRVYEAGYRKFDTYSPFPVEGLTRAMHLRPSRLPLVILAGGVLGLLGGFGMQVYATGINNPFNIGGRPLFSWPAYVPIAFELMVLTAVFFGVIGFFIFARLPQPYHPIFESEDFNEHGSKDAFYLAIEADDQKFEVERTRQLLQGLSPTGVSEINT